MLETLVWWVAQTCVNVFTDIKVVFPLLLTGHQSMLKIIMVEKSIIAFFFNFTVPWKS